MQSSSSTNANAAILWIVVIISLANIIKKKYELKYMVRK
jgi:hypothetical protein